MKLNTYRWNYCIIHPGQAHNDDVLAAAFAQILQDDEDYLPLHRREPTEEELNNPNVLVLDVGMRHEPELSNYDHHQLPDDHDPECALSLLLKHRAPELHAALMLTAWYPSLIEIDSKGPFAWAAARGLDTFPFGLVGAIDGPVKALFESMGPDDILGRPLQDSSEVWPLWLLAHIATNHVSYAQKLLSSFRLIEEIAEPVEVEGVAGVLFDSTEVAAMQQWRDRTLEKEGLELAFSISRDDRGGGWSLYRFNDDPGIDFSKHIITLKPKPEYVEGVSFSHPGGFISKTEDLSKEELLKLVRSAVTSFE